MAESRSLEPHSSLLGQAVKKLLSTSLLNQSTDHLGRPTCLRCLVTAPMEA